MHKTKGRHKLGDVIGSYKKANRASIEKAPGWRVYEYTNAGTTQSKDTETSVATGRKSNKSYRRVIGEAI